MKALLTSVSFCNEFFSSVTVEREVTSNETETGEHKRLTLSGA